MTQQYWTIISIFIGGAIGTLLRYFINLQTVTLLFPIGTLFENLLGSLLLGTLTGWVAVKVIPSFLKVGLGVGFCGGFTTMSTLAADSAFLAGQASLFQSGMYLITSLIGGVLFALLGMLLGHRLATKQKVGERA
ncbi:fluoride efflux transporter FluC [Salipaludibacillus daqingensis]|uniref:fluoride efflux transporter FluC n=1 Tax=Salipaludibacillus daqingensis TaxID=3041001 RepID=UPI0024738AC3|nr:CrcB family protein [Salipaludibacillus daqingensis]